KQVIIEQMASCRNQKNWFVPMSNALAGLTAKQASERDESENHSIWQIVNHLIFWNERWLIRFKSIPPPKIKGSNNETFENKKGSEEDWKLTVKKLDDVLGEWETELMMAEESKLLNEPVEGAGGEWFDVLSQIALHNAYHIGQIVHLRKQHGNWDSKHGVS
ncbi:MAG: DinB family protein, partial [Chlorobi bacterium]|nr:DinB family protein [Chlorobiota bacterium]